MYYLPCDHSRGLCGKPELSGYGLTEEEVNKLSLPLEVARVNPPQCRCCGKPMRVVETALSSSLQELGMYELVCDTC